jgi:hypothetical protein
MTNPDPNPETMLKIVQVFARLSGEDFEKLHAEALSQYVNRREGRKPGLALHDLALI